jgi:predicted TIM-barrel fold metal-dependent hydrolase
VARPHGPPFRRPGLQQHRAQDAAQRTFSARNCWISFEPVENSIAVLADYIGPHKIMWATDYPHRDGFFPGAPQMLRDRLGRLSPEAKHQVMAGGAMGFYGLQ